MSMTFCLCNFQHTLAPFSITHERCVGKVSFACRSCNTLLSFEEEMVIAICVVEQHVEQYILRLIGESLLVQVGGFNASLCCNMPL